MNKIRSSLLGILMALVFCAMILGSGSLAMLESGYALAQAPTVGVTLFSFPGEPILTLANAAAGQVVATSTPPIIQAATSFAPLVDCPPPPGWIAISIQVEDTLRGLARRYGTSVDALKAANCLAASSLIAGSDLYVPPLPPAAPTPRCGPPLGWVIYLVRPGDTLARLSGALGVSIWQLQSANCLGSSTNIWVGQRLYVPFYPPTYATAYPTATRWLSPTPLSPTATRPVISTPTVPIPPTWTLPPTPEEVTPTATLPGGVTDTPPPPTGPPPTEPPPTEPPPTEPPPTEPPPPTSVPPTPTAFPYP